MPRGERPERNDGSRLVVRADAGANVVADTFLRFKGLERPHVVVTETADPGMTLYPTRMHIALTRATVGTVVVTTPEACAADPRLAELADAAGRASSGLR